MKAACCVIGVLSCGLLLSQAEAQQRESDNPYPLLIHFAGKHRQFAATLVSAVQSEDGMIMEAGSEKYFYLDGKIRIESEFSQQWMALFALAPPDTNAIKRAGMDITVEICIPEKKKLYIVFPNAKAYCEMELPADIHPPRDGDLKVERAADGVEVVDGHRCTRSKLTIREGQATAGCPVEKLESVLWEAQDLGGFPIKIQTRFGGMFVSTEAFTEIKLAAPQPLVFAPPAGFKKYQSVEEFSEAIRAILAAEDKRIEDFWKAVESGDLTALESLLRQEPGLLQGRTKDEQTPLHVAARAGRKESVQWLIAKGVDINAHDNKKSTPLHEAAANDSSDIIDALLKAGAEIDALDNEECTALHVAAAHGEKEIVALLIAHKAKPDVRNKRGLTPLWEAMLQDHEDSVVLLAKNGADINAVGLEKQTPLLWATLNDRKAMAEALVINGADASVKDKSGQPLLLTIMASADTRMFQTVVANARNINAQRNDGRTALHMAVSQGSAEFVRLLLAGGADVNVTDKAGDTPVLLAVQANVKDTLQLLLAMHANLEARGSHAMTALHLAAQEGAKEIVELLIKAGAVPCTYSTERQRASQYAFQAGHKELANFLKPYEERSWPQFTALAECLRAGTIEKFKELLNSTPPLVYCGDQNGESLLHTAVRLQRKEFVGFLLSRGADPNWPSQDGNPLLNQAVASDDDDIVRLLLEHGANVEARNRRNRTPLFDTRRVTTARLLLSFHAEVDAWGDNVDSVPLICAVPLDVAGFLLDNHANINIARYGSTPLHFAVAKHDRPRVKIFLTHGADANAQDAWGGSPMTYATRDGLQDIVELLIRNGARPLPTEQTNSMTTVEMLLRAVDVDDIVRVKDLLSSDPSLTNEALYRAVSQAMTNITIQLLESGAEANPKGDGWKPLHEAVFGRYTDRQGYDDIVALLVAHGADVNATIEYRKTPLHLAALLGRARATEILLANRADVKAVDSLGRTPLHIAAEQGHGQIAKLLLDAGADLRSRDKGGRTPYNTAVARGHTNVVTIFMEAGANAREVDANGDTPLHTVKNEAAARLLLEAGGDPNAADRHHRTPLLNAVSMGHRDVVAILISNGSAIDARDERGWTPLHEAAARGHQEIAEILIARNADVNAQSKDGKTPLHVATTREMVDCLFAHGAKGNILATDGLSPAGEARKLKRNELAAYIEQHSGK